ncbi:response regulator [Geopsychrobacter electrodiphilus]|uniref:response regulator n=1 Tax=Geopsychrobacter electrodiphilus TaxID=225196 RepID=UPI000372957A|nr:response regulator [Geopsychrobacter electrodiphilus]
MRILLVEDDAMIAIAVRQGLIIEGYAVDWAQDAADAELALETEDYELVLLDLGLPDRSGLEVLADLRKKGNAVAVLILTARDAVADRIAGLDTGADDYLVKPFDLDELSARIRAVQRRQQGRAEPLLCHGTLCLNPASHKCTLNGLEITLSAKEFSLLQALIDRPGAVLSRAQLEEKLYSWGSEIESNAIEVHIHNLRKKLGADAIRTLRGVGYLLGNLK